MSKGETGGSLGHLYVCVFLYHFSAFMVIPAITDVTMAALCPGTDHCSLAIYLSGFQQAVTGLGALVATPFIGNLSDKYGRRALLALPMTAAIIPSTILSYDRSRSFFYAYYAVSTLSNVFSKGSMQCLTLAYVADMVGEGQRAAAFGVVSGVATAGFVTGTLVARFVPTEFTFQVAASGQLLAAVYMRVFLVESVATESAVEEDGPAEKLLGGRASPTARDMLLLLRSSATFTQAAIIAFLSSFGDSGLQDSLLYYLKAKFHFNKDQFANLLLIFGIAGAFSQLLLMPMIVPVIGEGKLLKIALLASCAHLFLYSIAWASWVPYAAAMFTVASIFTHPCLRSIISRMVRSSEQGMAQGCISGVCSFASILAPFAISPLTALFLSDRAPFYFPGFSIMCVGFISMAAFIQSLIMKGVDSPPLSHKDCSAEHA